MSTPTGLPVKHEITIYQGDAWLRQFRFWYADAAGASQLLDTTGWTGRMQIKAAKSDAIPLLSSDPVTNEVKTVTLTGSPTGGTFVLTFGGQTTAAIAWNATAAAVQTALEALSTIGVGDIACTGGPLPGTPVTITFTGSLGGRDIGSLTSASSLTGGSSPGVTTAATVQGASGPILVTTGLQGTAPDQWVLEVFIPGTETTELPGGLVGFYDLEVTDASGRTTTFFFGTCCVEQGVTV